MKFTSTVKDSVLFLSQKQKKTYSWQDLLWYWRVGLWKGKSCVSQLLLVYDEIGKHRDSGLETDLILLDFAKAFDSVCHTKLLQKLSWFGVHGPLIAWFENYLSHRMQRVVINGSFSN